VTAHPQAVANLAVNKLDGVLSKELNHWAGDGTSWKPLAVFDVGKWVGSIENNVLTGSALAEGEKAKRRMVSSLVGTAISAACGDADAQNRLKEMCPFWSWVVMGKSVSRLWLLAQYYEAGKEAAQLEMQMLGDVSLGVGLIKGATVLAKMTGNALKMGLRKMASKIGGVFEAKPIVPAEPPPLPKLDAEAGRVLAQTPPEAVDAGIKWGAGNNAQGLPFEDWWNANKKPGSARRLPPGFPGLDDVDDSQHVAYSLKTTNTQTPSKLANPKRVGQKIKRDVDSLDRLNGTISRSGDRVDMSTIRTRELHVAVPIGTTPEQWVEIQKAIQYGKIQTHRIDVIITITR
jgi:filamentous hemagglutinin